MLFNSIGYALFLPTIFYFYWYIGKGNLKTQNFILLISSYFFYSFWDWRFMFLLIFSTFLDYFTGIKIFSASNQSRKLFWLWLSISINLGLLALFKYYNFFLNSFNAVVYKFGFHSNLTTLNLILPIGISFYTFHGLSYVIDIYKKRIEPERNFIDYSVFVSFFPLLVAGPIERATHLLPQILKKRKFNHLSAVDGLRQILWGLFKKIVIADQCAEYANLIFNNSINFTGITLFLGALFFTFQIYCDFSGYSDIAIGTARLFGINLLKNFAFPYFSRDIAEFWRRWHISLSSWFKDYLYIPLGGSKGGTWLKIRNTFIIFLVSGFWHGANWTFIVWGGLNALFIMPSIIFNTNRNNLDIVAKGKRIPSLKECLYIIITFTLTVFTWIFFRANNLKHAIAYISSLLTGLTQKEGYLETFELFQNRIGVYLPIFIGIFIFMEWLGREHEYALEKTGKNWNKTFRYMMYYSLIISIFYFVGKDQQFIYFQF